MKIVLSAAYGMGNIGDEAIADMAVAHLREVAPGARITVLVSDHVVWREAHPSSDVRALPGFFSRSFARPSAWPGLARSFFAVAACDAFVWGGGGLVRNRTVWLRQYLRGTRLASFFRKPVIVLAVGVEAIADADVKRLLRALRSADAVSVRDDNSKRNLVDAVPGLRVDVVSDGVFHWPAVRHNPPARPVLGVNLCNVEGSGGMDDAIRGWLDDLSSVLLAAGEGKDFDVVSLPTNKKDEKFSTYFCSLSPGRTHAVAATPAAYVGRLAGCTAFVGMRLHSCILASRVEGLPTLCFAYAAKTMDMFRACGAGASAFPLDAVRSAAFRDALDTALSGAVVPALRPGESAVHPCEWLRARLSR